MTLARRSTADRTGLLLVLALVLGLLPFVMSRATAAGNDPVITDTTLQNCNGIATTPGSQNTLKDIVGGTLERGGTAVFRISYPVDAAGLGGEFHITDCFERSDTHAVLSAKDIAFVPNAASYTFEYTLTIPADVPIGTQVCNYAKTTQTPSHSQGSNRKGAVCFSVGGTLRVEKQDAGTGQLLPGAKFTVACTPTATFPSVVIAGLSSAAQNGTAVTTNPATGYATDGAIAVNGPEGTPCVVTELAAPAGYVTPPAPGGTHTYTIPSAGSAAGVKVIQNTAQAPVPTISKTSLPLTGTTIARGTPIAFSVVLGNTGTGTATGDVVDALPAGLTTPTLVSDSGAWDSTARTLTWTGVTVAAGGTRTLTYTASVADDAAPGSLTNTVTWLGGTATTTHTVPALVPAPTLAKTADPASGTTVARGSTVAYTVTAGNTGTGSATGPVTDVLPAGLEAPTGISDGGSYDSASRTITWTGVTVAGAQTKPLTYKAVVSGDATGTLVNTASWLQQSASTTHTVGVPAASLTKTSVPATGSTVQAGDLVSYSLVAGSTGTGPLSPAVVVDTLPASFVLDPSSVSDGGTFDASAGTITWDLGTLAPGATRTLTYSGLVAAVTTATTMTNTATLDDETASTTHTAQPNGLGLVKSVATTGTVQPGSTLTYTLVASATGGVAEKQVVVTDRVPGTDPQHPASGRTTLVPGSAVCSGAGTCTVTVDAATGLVSWAVGDLAPGTSRTVRFSVTVDQPATAGAKVADVLNAGAVSSARTPSQPSNLVTTPVTVVSSVVVQKPPTTTTPKATKAKKAAPAPATLPFTAPAPSRVLPFTGAWVLPTLASGLLLSLVGSLLVVTGRRRRA